MDDIGRAYNKASQPLFLQPFDAKSSFCLVPKPYDGAGASEGNYDTYDNADENARIGRARSHSSSPCLTAGSFFPSLDQQFKSVEPTLERRDGTRSRAGSVGPSAVYSYGSGT
jgi:hypothetical protein